LEQIPRNAARDDGVTQEVPLMKLHYTAVLPLIAAAGLLAGCAGTAKTASRTTQSATGARSGFTTSAPSGSDASGGAASLNGLGSGPMSPQQVVKLVTPSIVRVQASGGSHSGIFGRSEQSQGTGTGVIIDGQGHILTNNHVVTLESSSTASDIQVALSDGRTLPAKVVGRDPNTDLAVIQIDAKDVTPAKFAPVGSVEVGEPVLAIGYALNLQGTPTVTSGVVSALDRVIPETTTSISGAIQTDAPINPGNSGGPLLDLSGEVVGINTAGQTGTQGIFFAISSDVTQPVVKDLISKGKIDRGFIGIATHSTTPDEAQSQKLPVSTGVSIDTVQPGTPADKAGLRAGDIIVKLGNQDIHNTGDLQQALISTPPGTKVTVTYYHSNDKKTADITLATRPDNVG
jgi:serine protease Do